MTTISVPGKIVSISTEDDFDIVSLTGTDSPGTPTTISPSGAEVTIILAQRQANGNGGVFKLDSSFNIGDVVEVYSGGGGYAVQDENGVVAASAGNSPGARLRKIMTGTPSFGLSTWGLT